MALIWFLSSRAITTIPFPLFPHADKLIHFIEFAILGALMTKGLGTRLWLAAFTLSCLYGVVDEFHQSFVPGRSCSVGDVLSDFSGIFVACLYLRVRPRIDS
jgi:VanZ family protein